MPIGSWTNTRAIGLSARRHSFTDPVDSSVFYCDSSFVLNVITHIRNTNERFKTECSDFLKKLVDRTPDGLVLVTSDFAIDEILYKIAQHDLESLLPCPHPTAGYMLQKPTQLCKVMPGSMAHCSDKIDAFCNFIDNIPFLVLSPNDMKDWVGQIYLEATRLVKTYHLWSGDAFHIATGMAAGVNCFVAVDSDWLRVDEIELYTCLSP